MDADRHLKELTELAILIAERVTFDYEPQRLTDLLDTMRHRLADWPKEGEAG